MEKILITGASGFIGSFIVEEALRRGMEVWAAIRRSSSREWLQDERIHFIELNLSSEDDLVHQLEGRMFDYVVHAAGVTKCLKKEQFYRVNTEGTRHLVNALLRLHMPLKKFVYLSSLSIFGAIREKQPYEAIRETDTPQPNTEYGKSKLAAEEFLKSIECRTESVEFATAQYFSAKAHNSQSFDTNAIAEANSALYTLHSEFPYVILRPTGVYGPREKDYFLMAKSIKGHTDFAVGFQQQDITFVYVLDVVQAVFLALEHGQIGRSYFLSDGEVYQSATFSDLIIRELGNPWCLRIKAPIWLLRIVTFFGEIAGNATGKVTALNNDKYHILKQRNWRCDIQPAIDELGYQPQYPLDRGVKETMKWYQEHGWI